MHSIDKEKFISTISPILRISLSLILGFLLLTGCSSDDEPDIIENDPEDPEEIVEKPFNRTYEVDKQQVGDYFVEIFYPSDYESTRLYPIMYFNDGDLMAEIFGRLTSLRIDPFIMVGIAATNPRAERFLAYDDPGIPNEPRAREYSEAIVNEIIPAVESQYSVNTLKRAIFGISFGGLHATWIGIKYPDVFSFSGAISPSFWVGGDAIMSDTVDQLKVQGPSNSNTFYFDRGTAEWYQLTPFIDHLKINAGLRYGKEIFYYEVLGATHSGPSWEQRVTSHLGCSLKG